MRRLVLRDVKIYCLVFILNSMNCYMNGLIDSLREYNRKFKNRFRYI